MKVYILLIIITSFAFGFLEKVDSKPSHHPFEAIFNFGDSLSDTGNFLASGAILFPVIGKLPYGETFFKHATGRCSDGRLVIDFIDCDSYFKRSLFLVGEIGGNDYNYAAFAGNITQLQANVPLVVEAITKTISELIAEGAVELLVPGNLPIGCSALYLTLFRSRNIEDYDKSGCLKAFNGFAEYHNKQLNLALETLRQKNPHGRIMYADYYRAAKRFFHAPGHYGFTSGALRACCGGGGPFNFIMSARCGHIGSKTCADPSTYANWDGIHLTEAAYRHIAKGLINGPFLNPPLKPSPLR